MNVDVLDESGAEVDVAALTRLARFVMRRMRLHPATELTLRLVEPATIAVGRVAGSASSWSAAS